MKKLFIVVLLALGLNGFAQGKNTKATKKLGQMTTELTLTAEQQKNILPLIEEQVALYDEIKANPDTKDTNRTKIREVGNKINAILTPEQIARQKELKANK